MHISSGFYWCSFVLYLFARLHTYIFVFRWAYLSLSHCQIHHRINVWWCIFVHSRFLSSWKCVYLSFVYMRYEEKIRMKHWNNTQEVQTKWRKKVQIYSLGKLDQVGWWFVFFCCWLLSLLHFIPFVSAYTISALISRWNINIRVFLDRLLFSTSTEHIRFESVCVCVCFYFILQCCQRAQIW